MNFIEHIQNFSDESLSELPVKKQERMTQIGVLAGLLSHAGWLIFLLYVGEYAIAVINVISIGYFVYLFYLTKKRQFFLAILLTILQVVAFSICSTYLFGHELKFYYYLLLVCTLPYFLKKPNYLLHIGISSVGIVVFAFCVASPNSFGDGVIILEPWLTQILSVANIIFPLFLMTVLIYVDNYYAYEMSKKLVLQKTYSDVLLEKILPKYIIKKIEQGNKDLVEEVPLASIAFLDLIGFTALSAKRAPKETVEVLNAFFSLCDELIVKHQIERVKTIGDAYMAVSGVNGSHDKDDAVRIVAFALEVVETLRDASEWSKYYGLRVRIGINSGTVMAGVINEEILAFDIWGHAVNVASRLESSGLANEVAVSEATYELVKDRFSLKEIIQVMLKGVGDSKAYLLENKNTKS